jgi:DNA-binding MarR family transcriptional regulator
LTESSIGALVRSDIGSDLAELAAGVEQISVIHRDAAEGALRRAGISETLAAVLWTLHMAEAEPTMKELSVQLSCDPSNVTLLALQLERGGLAERVAHSDDRRRRSIRLTVAGHRAATEMAGAIAAASPLRHLTRDQVRVMSADVRAALHAASSSGHQVGPGV